MQRTVVRRVDDERVVQLPECFQLLHNGRHVRIDGLKRLKAPAVLRTRATASGAVDTRHLLDGSAAAAPAIQEVAEVRDRVVHRPVDTGAVHKPVVVHRLLVPVGCAWRLDAREPAASRTRRGRQAPLHQDQTRQSHARKTSPTACASSTINMLMRRCERTHLSLNCGAGAAGWWHVGNATMAKNGAASSPLGVRNPAAAAAFARRRAAACLPMNAKLRFAMMSGK